MLTMQVTQVIDCTPNELLVRDGSGPIQVRVSGESGRNSWLNDCFPCRSDRAYMKAVTKEKLTPYTKDFVTSADGTRIGYRQPGSGPGVVLLHGGVNASQHLMRLGSALAGTFTVYIPDRRGRGMSGPLGADYGLRAEDEDLAVLLKQTGARNVFGMADGALFALHGALSLPTSKRWRLTSRYSSSTSPAWISSSASCSSSTSSWPGAGWAMPSSPRSKGLRYAEIMGLDSAAPPSTVPQLRDASRGQEDQR